MMNDSLFRQNGCLRLLHEGIPPAPDSVWPAPGVPPLPAEPFSPAALTASAFWPQELPSPVFSSPHPAPDPDPDPEEHPSQKPYPFLNISLPSDGTPEKTGLAAPLYLCGSATSSMDVARSLIAADQLPVWGSWGDRGFRHRAMSTLPCGFRCVHPSQRQPPHRQWGDSLPRRLQGWGFLPT
ncbi:MAG: hypothetical protein RR317_05000 [Bilophila sp.]